MLITSHYGFSQGFENFDRSVLDLGHSHNTTTGKELTDNAISRLDGLNDPFFVWIHYFDPHYRYLLHEDFTLGFSSIDKYDGEIFYTDYHIGRLIDELKRRNLYDDSIIVITSDHGEEFRDHGGRLHTNSLYEELVHVPLIIKVPCMRDGVINGIVAESDIMPTLLSLVGLDVPDDVSGDIIPFNKDGFEPVSKKVYLETRRVANLRGLIDGRYKIISNKRNGQVQLYDLVEDPLEKKNIAKAKANIANSMSKNLEDFYSNSFSKTLRG